MLAWIAHPVVLLVEGLEWLLARAAGAVPLLALLAIGHGAAHVLPPYVTHCRLRDRVAEIARTPLRGDAPEIPTLLTQAVRERGMDAYIPDGAFRIESKDLSRRITCRYEMPVEILPGLMRILEFRIDVEQPVLLQQDPQFI